jgi:hypothetical protein
VRWRPQSARYGSLPACTSCLPRNSRFSSPTDSEEINYEYDLRFTSTVRLVCLVLYHTIQLDGYAHTSAGVACPKFLARPLRIGRSPSKDSIHVLGADPKTCHEQKGATMHARLLRCYPNHDQRRRARSSRLDFEYHSTVRRGFVSGIIPRP